MVDLDSGKIIVFSLAKFRRENELCVFETGSENILALFIFKVCFIVPCDRKIFL